MNPTPHPTLTHDEAVQFDSHIARISADSALSMVPGVFVRPPVGPAEQAQRLLMQSALLTERLHREHANLVALVSKAHRVILTELISLIQFMDHLPESMRADFLRHHRIIVNVTKELPIAKLGDSTQPATEPPSTQPAP